MAVAPIALALAAHPEAGELRPVVAALHHVVRDAGDEERRRRGHPQGRGVLGDGLRRQRAAGHRVQLARRRAAGHRRPGGARCGAPDRVAGDRRPGGPGEVGEIQVRSQSAMAGYLPDDATSDAFSDGWYRTGDVGYLDAEGWLRITDRAKEMIKVRGFQVAPAEIEAVLHGHPAVADCAVFGIARRGCRRVRRRGGDALRCGRIRRVDRSRRRPAGLLQAAEPRGVRPRDPPSAFGKGVAPSAKGAAMDVRLTAEQRQLREAAAKLADDLGPGIGRRAG